LSGTSSSIKTKLRWNSHWMVLFQNGVRQLRSPAKMATTVQLRCYWKQLWSRWAITGSWEPLVLICRFNITQFKTQGSIGSWTLAWGTKFKIGCNGKNFISIFFRTRNVNVIVYDQKQLCDTKIQFCTINVPMSIWFIC
jgi:hypothetical protein